MDSDRKTAAALLLTHAAMLLFFALVTAAGVLGFMVQGGLAWNESRDPALLAIFGAIGGVQGLVSVGALLCAAFETLAAVRALNGEGRTLRTAAGLGIAASVGLVPFSLMACSICGLAYWPVVLATGAAALVFANRARPPA